MGNLYYQICDTVYKLQDKGYKNIVVLVRPDDYIVLMNDPEFVRMAKNYGFLDSNPTNWSKLSVYGCPIIITDRIHHVLILHDEGRVYGQ